MAAIVFTESGRQLAAQQLAEMPSQYDESITSLVAVVWSSGVKDNRRGPEGQVVWETTEMPGWRAVVVAWCGMESAVLAGLTEIDGLRVYVDPRAGFAAGTFVLSAVNGQLSVEHRAT